MRRRRLDALRFVGARALPVLLTAGVTVGLPASPAASAPGPGVTVPTTALDGGGATASVTLITGDRVLLDRRGDIAGVTPAKGRESMPVQTVRSGDHRYVIPADAAELIAAGKLDQALFDVTELNRPQYDRQAGGGVPVIVKWGRSRAGARAELAGRSSTALRQLSVVGADALTLKPGEADDAWSSLTTTPSGTTALAPGVASVHLDRALQVSLNESVPQIGAPSAWAAGFDGRGVKVAVVDSGIDDGHPDLAGKVVAAKNFSAAEGTRDAHGHGTHVASTIAGSGEASGGAYKGVAPGAELINARALDAKGWGSDSSVLAAVEWAVEAGADVVNLSLGATDTPGIDLLEETVNKLSDQALFVIAAGNDGPAATTVGSPGSAEQALTVGAVDGKDALAAFSSRGPVVGDGAVKPEVTAPGVDITAAKFNSSGYQAMSGTSMAAPHVAGAAALLAQQHPGWSGQQIKADLVGSAEPGAHTPYEQGTGRIDVTRAIGQTVVAETPALNFGTTTWPHTDDEPVTRTLTYRNYGDAAVTLQLTTETTAPSGLFTLGSDRLTVPAGGTAAVEVTADTRKGGDAAGAYALTVVAAGGGQNVRTSGGVRSEEQMVDVTMTATLRDGSTPAPGSWRVLLLDLETSRLQYAGGENGTATVRVPVSPYMVVGTVSGYQEDRLLVDYVAAPKLRIDRDMALDIDARKTKGFDVTVPDPSATQRISHAALSATENGTTTSTTLYLGNDLGSVRTAQLDGAAPDDEGTSYLVSQWFGSGSTYVVADTLPGAFFTGHSQHVSWDDLAEFTLRQGASLPGAKAATWVTSPELPLQTILLSTSPPATTKTYLQDDYAWKHAFNQIGPKYSYVLGYETPAARYAGGRSYSATVNTGVFGPALGEDSGLVRDGNTLTGTIHPFADAAGHAGFSAYDTATTTVYRNGKKYASYNDVLDAARFELPAGRAYYRLETTVDRSASGVATVSPKITWQTEFVSARTAGATPVPTSVVRYAPELGLDSTAPAGAAWAVPVTVQGAAAGRPVYVSVSYDSGATWAYVPVVNGRVTVTNPPAGGTVSFRARVADGQATAQTVIDAYRTK